MRASRSETLRIRGIDLHCRAWGPDGGPPIVLLHGGQDASATWQFTVDAFATERRVIAPDWRGHGLSGWSGADTYTFADYVGDLDALLAHWSPERPAHLVGHSLGAQVASVYAGVRADRVATLVNVDGYGPPGGRQDPVPRRFARWLASLPDETAQRPYDSFEEFALRLMSENPRLTEDRARFIAQAWGRQAPDGSVVRRADPALKRTAPVPLAPQDLIDCWRGTQAPVLWIDGTESGLWARLTADPGAFEARAGAYERLSIEHVAGAGHNVHHDQPERLAALIESFVDG